MTSIEWLIDQLEQKGDMRETSSIRNLQLNIDTSDYLELKRQAKEMHKQEIMNTYIIADSESTQEDSEHYALKFYERTYGSKGNDEVKEESLVEKMIPHQLKYNLDVMEKLTRTSPQTEISDEEIEKSAKEWYEKEGRVHYNAEIRAWVSACKWYREQLKSKK